MESQLGKIYIHKFKVHVSYNIDKSSVGFF